MKRFEETVHCKSHAHCETCRNLEGGRKWRESLRKAFLLPNNETDFTCPHGYPWGFIPAIKIASTIPSEVKPVPNPQLVIELQKRKTICEACEQFINGKCYRRKGCCFKAWRNRLTSRCPLNKWKPINVK